MANFGWEYVWHCHILGHEENDFMRPVVFNYTALTPSAPAMLSATPDGVLTWEDPTPAATSLVTKPMRSVRIQRQQSVLPGCQGLFVIGRHLQMLQPIPTARLPERHTVIASSRSMLRHFCGVECTDHGATAFAPTGLQAAPNATAVALSW